MPWATVVDLTGSDDDEEPKHVSSTLGRAQQTGSASVLAAALTRAGRETFSGTSAGERSPVGGSSLLARTPQNQQQCLSAFGTGLVSRLHYHNPLFYSPLTLSVASPSTFKITCESTLPPACVTIARSTPGAVLKDNQWELPLSQHVNFCVAMQNERIVCERIPQRVLASLATAQLDDEDFRAGNARMDDEGYARGDDDEDSVSDIPRSIWNALAPFQKYGVSWIVRNNGRALLADEPGLGKTIQAIGAACAYYHEWPVLVVSPSSARFHWEAEFLQWLPDEDYLPRDGILVITSERIAATTAVDRAKILVTSYDLVHREAVRKTLTRVAPNVIICDECHYLKNGKAQRTKALLPIIKASRRAILLSGTPALSRPMEVFWQLHALDDKQWTDPADFNKRYCSGRRKKDDPKDTNEDGEKKKEYSAASNLEELHTLLRATLMLRRNKASILTQLPPKRRVQRKVSIDDVSLALELRSDLEEFRARASELAELSNNQKRARRKRSKRSWLGVKEDTHVTLSTTLSGYATIEREDLQSPEMVRKEMAAKKKALLMELFRRSGPAKLPAIERRISDLLHGVDEERFSGKMLVFAHHRKVLDTLANGILRDIKYIRIDGTTPAKDRQSRVTTFQNDAKVRVALLGITAAGIALTLTAASRVIFTELYWTPAALLQAEDRAHRIGQTSEVVVEYLLADDCVDEILWPLIQHKMLMLGELFENKKDQCLHSSNEKAQDMGTLIKSKCDANINDETDDGKRDVDDISSNEDPLLELDELEQLHHEDPEAVDLEHDNDENNGRITPPPQYPTRQDPDAEICFQSDSFHRADDDNAAEIVANLLNGDQFLGDF
mmetsp:Transcript_18830/g.61423  ORF Transcript_18830/g.61423 Transcript_18830/m.61423 type:complete len:843 (+) Transcript_18830:58-2586(+)